MAKSNIAIMMTVHKNEEQVNRLIEHLSKDFDIYVHVDKNSSLKLNNAENVFIYQKYKVYWGSFNQIMATLFLLKMAFENQYERYLLISGQDLPIKTNEQIKQFFKDNDNEYLEIDKIPNKDGWPDMTRLTQYHLNAMNRRANNSKYIVELTHMLSNTLLKIKPRKIKLNLYGGANWINFTNSGVSKILAYLDKNPQYIKRFKWTNCADEIFYQTIIPQLNGIKVVNNSLRYVNWKDGPEFPKMLRKVDFEKIKASDALFARKFDPEIDKEVIEMVYNQILS